jgi:sensor histidine kinase YesM
MQQADINTAILRLTYGLEGLQKDLAVLKDQLRQFEAGYVPSRENELQLNALRDSIRRMENDINGMHKQLDRLEQMVRDQEIAARDRDNAARDRDNKLREDLNNHINTIVTNFKSWQIKVILWFVSPVFLGILALIGDLIYNYIINVH